MDLSYHIEELLFLNDCVIIPTIGGFIVNHTSASIDFVEQQLLPPQKTVSFNPKLVNNDGLLANHIAQKEHLTYKQATLKVEAFSRQIESDLFNNKIVHFEKIGKLYFNSDSKLEFVPADTNFLKDAFGLPNLTCTPILRSKDYLKEESEHLVPIRRKRKTGGVLLILAQPRVVAAAAILIFILSTPFIYRAIVGTPTDDSSTVVASNDNPQTKDTNSSSQASLIPSFSNDNTTTITPSTELVESEAIDTIAETVVENLPVIDENAKEYIIVLGAFGKKRNASRLAKKLEKDNYLPDVTVKNGLNRVGVQITCTPEELKEHLDFLQENYNKKAWVVE